MQDDAKHVKMGIGVLLFIKIECHNSVVALLALATVVCASAVQGECKNLHVWHTLY